MGTLRKLAAAAALTIALGACANGTLTEQAPTTTPSTSAGSAEVSPPALETPPTEGTPIVEPPLESSPYIVSCQMGLGPIETYWSDGSVTGYSDYCQAQHDQSSRSEVEANTPTCDGTVCRYPSGATIPDQQTPAIPRTPSPWVQGQIDYFNCIDAGNSEEFCLER